MRLSSPCYAAWTDSAVLQVMLSLATHMKTRFQLTTLLAPATALVLLCSSASAQEVETPEHEVLLDRMVGEWVMTGPIAGEQVTHDVNAGWILGRRYVRLHELAREQDENGDPAYEAWIDIAWDPENAEYVVMWLDNTETTNFEEEGVGHGTPDGDRIPFVWRLADGSGIRNTFAYDRADDTWTWTIENVGGSGQSAPFASLLLRRK